MYVWFYQKGLHCSSDWPGAHASLHCSQTQGSLLASTAVLGSKAGLNSTAPPYKSQNSAVVPQCLSPRHISSPSHQVLTTDHFLMDIPWTLQLTQTFQNPPAPHIQLKSEHPLIHLLPLNSSWNESLQSCQSRLQSCQNQPPPPQLHFFKWLITKQQSQRYHSGYWSLAGGWEQPSSIYTELTRCL